MFLKNFHCTWSSKIENFKYCKSSISWKLQNDPRVSGLAQIARMCFRIMQRCVVDTQSYCNHYFLNLHTPLKRWIIENMVKISSKSIVLLILRVGWAINGAKMEVKISSVILPQNLACFLDFFSIVFFSDSDLKKMDHRKYSENLIFQIVVYLRSWTLYELLIALNCSLTSSLTLYLMV